MQGNKTKIEVMREATSKDDYMHFVSIYIPKSEFLDGPEISILHYPTHLAVMFPTIENPAYRFKPCSKGKANIEDKLWGEYDMADFFTREFDSLNGKVKDDV